jgi:hypothetical protein
MRATTAGWPRGRRGRPPRAAPCRRRLPPPPRPWVWQTNPKPLAPRLASGGREPGGAGSGRCCPVNVSSIICRYRVRVRWSMRSWESLRHRTSRTHGLARSHGPSEEDLDDPKVDIRSMSRCMAAFRQRPGYRRHSTAAGQCPGACGAPASHCPRAYSPCSPMFRCMQTDVPVRAADMPVHAADMPVHAAQGPGACRRTSRCVQTFPMHAALPPLEGRRAAAPPTVARQAAHRCLLDTVSKRYRLITPAPSRAAGVGSSGQEPDGTIGA